MAELVEFDCNKAYRFTMLKLLYLLLNTNVLVTKIEVKLLNYAVKVDSTYLYSLFCMGILYDCRLLRLLPWNKSEMTDKLNGFPTFSLYKGCCKTILVYTVAQIISAVAIVIASDNNAYAISYLVLQILEQVPTCFSLLFRIQLMRSTDFAKFPNNYKLSDIYNFERHFPFLESEVKELLDELCRSKYKSASQDKIIQILEFDLSSLRNSSQIPSKQ